MVGCWLSGDLEMEAGLEVEGLISSVYLAGIKMKMFVKAANDDVGCYFLYTARRSQFTLARTT